MGDNTSKIENSLLNNPIDAEWVEQAKRIKNELYTNPFRYFDYQDLAPLIKKTDEAMHRYKDGCGYIYQDLVDIRKAFDNARTIQMRDS